MTRACVCVFVCVYVCGQGTRCSRRDGHGAILSCPALLPRTHKAHSLALQLALCTLCLSLFCSLFVLITVTLLYLYHQPISLAAPLGKCHPEFFSLAFVPKGEGPAWALNSLLRPYDWLMALLGWDGPLHWLSVTCSHGNY